MTDQIQTPAPAQKSSAVQIHPKVAISTAAGALVAVGIYIAKLHGTDLAPIETQLVIIATTIAGYLTPSS